MVTKNVGEASWLLNTNLSCKQQQASSHIAVDIFNNIFSVQEQCINHKK